MRFKPDRVFIRRFPILLGGTVALTASIIYFQNHCAEWGLYENLTASLPRGLYKAVPAGGSRYVLFCPSGLASSFSVSHQYRTHGPCPDSYAPLLKPIVARTGDTVTVRPTGIWVNGQRLPQSQQFLTDAEHRPMPRYPAGTYSVAPGTAWVISSYSSASFDSRYYGPISLKDVIHYVRPFATF